MKYISITSKDDTKVKIGVTYREPVVNLLNLRL